MIEVRAICDNSECDNYYRVKNQQEPYTANNTHVAYAPSLFTCLKCGHDMTVKAVKVTETTTTEVEVIE